MSATVSLVSARLPHCLSAIVIDYFGRSVDSFIMAKFGQYEDCEKIPTDNEPRNTILQGACKGGHIDIVNLVLPRINDCKWALPHACFGGNINIVNILIAKGADGWNSGLIGACQGGHLGIAEMMITYGANFWNWGLAHACFGGHIDIVHLMIAHGADNWNQGLTNACGSKKSNIGIIELMISRGATYCGNCRKLAAEHARLSHQN